MGEIRFYHLTSQPLENALPALLVKALSTGRKIVVRFSSKAEVKNFNAHLWAYNPDSFLPHGSKEDGQAEHQPVYLTHGNDNPNKADMLVVCNASEVPEKIEDYTLCCDFLDGQNDEAVAQARERWKLYKEAGHDITYWQQTPAGGWEQKA